MERWEDYEELERELRETLGTIGKKYGILWLVLTVCGQVAWSYYEAPARFTTALWSGILAWALLFVVLPVYWTVSELNKLYARHYGGPTHRMTDHRYLAGANVLAVLYCFAATGLGWWVTVPLLVCPIVSLFTCFSLSKGAG